jgi:hypothetical protein
MLRFEQAYKVKVNDDLGSSSFWNVRLQDIDLRLNAGEAQYAKFDSAAQQIIDAGINRINTTIQPLLDGLIEVVNTATINVAALELAVTGDQASLDAQMTAILASANAILTELEALGTYDGGSF